MTWTKHKWAEYKIVTDIPSVWGRVLYASSIVTAKAMAKRYNGVIVKKESDKQTK